MKRARGPFPVYRNIRPTLFAALGTLSLCAGAVAQSPGFLPYTVLTVDSRNTYYDGSAGGTLFAAVPLPAGPSNLQFRVTGSVVTDTSGELASADGLYSNGQAAYNYSCTR